MTTTTADDAFETAAKALNVAVYVWRLRENSLWASPALVDLFGFDPADFTVEVHLANIHPEDRPAHDAQLQALLKSQANTGEVLYRFRVPGREHPRWVHNRMLLERGSDGRVIRVVGAVADVTREKLREAENAALIARQAASIEVLKTISASPDDPQPVFDMIARRSLELCAASAVVVVEPADGQLNLRAVAGFDRHNEERTRASYPRPLTPDLLAGRVALTGRLGHVPDWEGDTEYGEIAHARARAVGTRAMLGVPLMREAQVLGVIALHRNVPGAFDAGEIALVASFAEQAVIAIGSATTLRELRARTAELSRSLEELRTAQDRLVQTEKLASLGQLTAGIAHEIKNPLNFINNFSSLSGELLDELREVIAGSPLDPVRRAEADEIVATLKTNLDKVVQHGKRADGIVKNMLLHARSGAAERRVVDVNAMVEEALGLAYHGARAADPGFNIVLERDFDPALGEAALYVQDFARVLLNLIGNGFYAARKRAATMSGEMPTLWLTTRAVGTDIEIRVRDNGTGIDPELREKIFEPFFTTKPAGEGTGLGLSLSHDIVVKQHGGRIAVASEAGRFTEFVVTVPRA